MIAGMTSCRSKVDVRIENFFSIPGNHTLKLRTYFLQMSPTFLYMASSAVHQNDARSTDPLQQRANALTVSVRAEWHRDRARLYVQKAPIWELHTLRFASISQQARSQCAIYGVARNHDQVALVFAPLPKNFQALSTIEHARRCEHNSRLAVVYHRVRELRQKRRRQLLCGLTRPVIEKSKVGGTLLNHLSSN